MIDPLTGLQLLNRRRFLGDSVSGLSAIALTAMLKSSGLLAADDASKPGPIRPIIRPEEPLQAD